MVNDKILSKITLRSEEIRKSILSEVENFPNRIATITSQKFKISRQAVNRHLDILVGEGSLLSQGATRNKCYELASLKNFERRYELSKLSESEVWRRDLAPFIMPLPQNVMNIWQFCLTEMLNNAIDHSQGKTVSVTLEKNAAAITAKLHDNGIGIFKKIQNFLSLSDERHAVLELAKGKLTTDPSKHSGEGIFFSSRMTDDFVIASGSTFFSHEFEKPDWIIEKDNSVQGTTIEMKLSNHTARTTSGIFDQFTSADEYKFDKTIVPVRLTKYGDENLISRSQAKRMLLRFDRFKTVILDFAEVTSIGQSFADEIFRVFKSENPEIELIAENANQEVAQMISRARNH